MELKFLHLIALCVIGIYFILFYWAAKSYMNKPKFESITIGDLIRIKKRNETIYGRVVLIDRETGIGTLKSYIYPHEAIKFNDSEIREKL